MFAKCKKAKQLKGEKIRVTVSIMSLKYVITEIESKIMCFQFIFQKLDLNLKICII